LPTLLGAAWVEFHLPGHPDDSKTQNQRRSARSLELAGPAGPMGQLSLGPNVAPPLIAPDQLAGFLTTLLYLAQRDASLKHLATVDELTGAYNRRYLEYFLKQVIELSSQQNTEVTLLIFDIDDFKHYNDTYGHMAGDLILKQATRLMRRCCRAHDVVARMGGDEFAVLFWDSGAPRETPPDAADSQESTERRRSHQTHAHPEVAVFLSNRFRRMMKTSEFSLLGSEARGRLAISGGLASFPRDGRTVTELLARADEALLCAKRSGKDCIYLVGQP
jgi:GGDEF domain-containing protein